MPCAARPIPFGIANRSVPQKGAHQFVGQHLRPVRPERDRRLLPCLPDEPVRVLGVLGLLIVDGGQGGIEHARAAWSMASTVMAVFLSS